MFILSILLICVVYVFMHVLHSMYSIKCIVDAYTLVSYTIILFIILVASWRSKGGIVLCSRTPTKRYTSIYILVYILCRTVAAILVLYRLIIY